MSKYSRRQIIQVGLSATVAASLLSTRRAADAAAPDLTPLRLDASAPPPTPQTGILHTGTSRNPDGHSIGADSRSLLLNGKPWLPVMGEFHYTHYPEAEWGGALRRMKAGGIDIVSTYVFWIHHEEVAGHWDWKGRRNLHGFLQAVQQAGLTAFVRCGPWCHGEVRNGGFPDWLLADAKAQGYKTRSTDDRFLAQVRPLYAQIADQMKGLLWKDGGPVLGIQCDNEFRGPAAYLLALKGIAQTAGLDVPLYTRTAWPALSTPLPQWKATHVSLTFPLWLSADVAEQVFRKAQRAILGAENRPFKEQNVRMLYFVLQERRRRGIAGRGTETERRQIWNSWNEACRSSKAGTRKRTQSEVEAPGMPDPLASLEADWAVANFAYFTLTCNRMEERLFASFF